MPSRFSASLFFWIVLLLGHLIPGLQLSVLVFDLLPAQ
jgi:hypothetical protein